MSETDKNGKNEYKKDCWIILLKRIISWKKNIELQKKVLSVHIFIFNSSQHSGVW